MKAVHIISCIVLGFAVRVRSARMRLVYFEKSVSSFKIKKGKVT